MAAPLPIVLRCADRLVPRVRYVIDTLLGAGGVPVVYTDEPPSEGPWMLYGAPQSSSPAHSRCVLLAHVPEAWTLLEGRADVSGVERHGDLEVVLPQIARCEGVQLDVEFDLVANAFYFLSSWSERVAPAGTGTRGLYEHSVYRRLGIPQDIVDRYLARLMSALRERCERLGLQGWDPPGWPGGAQYAVLLSHDVDFIPSGWGDIVGQGIKTIARHLVRQRDPLDALRSAAGLTRALLRGQDPYGCVPEIIAREKSLGVRASFQIAVGHRHPNDVNYYIEDERTRAYLRKIVEEGFEVCLHGSYRSTENPDWYVEEAALLARSLATPIGSRQHFLSFSYDALFRAQERAGIQYDMSMGFPDQVGPRAGFSYPYFPYCLEEDRPYDVLQVSLFLMDVTLRGYMGLKGVAAWHRMQAQLEDLRNKRGCASVVWHPIVFGAARDPGYDDLFWQMVRFVKDTDGLPTDGRTINEFWRRHARNYASFA